MGVITQFMTGWAYLVGGGSSNSPYVVLTFKARRGYLKRNRVAFLSSTSTCLKTCLFKHPNSNFSTCSTLQITISLFLPTSSIISFGLACLSRLYPPHTVWMATREIPAITIFTNLDT